jgi:hypothetical protein
MGALICAVMLLSLVLAPWKLMTMGTTSFGREVRALRARNSMCREEDTPTVYSAELLLPRNAQFSLGRAGISILVDQQQDAR